jgi:hypothetical protein
MLTRLEVGCADDMVRDSTVLVEREEMSGSAAMHDRNNAVRRVECVSSKGARDSGEAVTSGCVV